MTRIHALKVDESVLATQGNAASKGTSGTSGAKKKGSMRRL